MAEEWDWSDLDDDGEPEQPKKVSPNDPKSLRQFAKKMADENKQLKEQFAKMASESRHRTIADKVAEKKLPAKVAKLVPADVDTEKLDDWLKEYEDLWAPPQAEGEGDAEDEEMVEESAAYGRMSQAAGASVPPTRPNDKMAELNDPNLTRDKLIRMIEQAGGGFGLG